MGFGLAFSAGRQHDTGTWLRPGMGSWEIVSGGRTHLDGEEVLDFEAGLHVTDKMLSCTPFSTGVRWHSCVQPVLAVSVKHADSTVKLP